MRSALLWRSIWPSFYQTSLVRIILRYPGTLLHIEQKLLSPLPSLDSTLLHENVVTIHDWRFQRWSMAYRGHGQDEYSK
jgi:hypothetical protein